MKTVIRIILIQGILYLLLGTNFSFAQMQSPDFKSRGYFYLDGITEQDGTTHLLYRLQKLEPWAKHQRHLQNDLFHYNTRTKTDSVFFESFSHRHNMGGGLYMYNVKQIVDYLFIDGRFPNFLIYYEAAQIEPFGGIIHYNEGDVLGNFLISGERILQSPIDDRIYFTENALYNNTLVGYDNGSHWPYASTDPDSNGADSSHIDFGVLAALPTESGQELFIGSRNDTLLYQAGLSGTSAILNLEYKWDHVREVHINHEQNHAYFSYQPDSTQKLLIWKMDTDNSIPGAVVESEYSFEEDFHLSLDDSTDGRLFAAHQSSILQSDDYGSTFDTWKKLDTTVTGIYYDAFNGHLYAGTYADILRFDASAPSNAPDTIRHTTATHLEERDQAESPQEVSLNQNYPNPFNPTTTITYTLKKPAKIVLSVYDGTGRKLFTVENGSRSAGTHNVRIDMSGYASGFYFYTLTTENRQLTRKMLLMK